jgi:site-specific DNA recombinase
MSNRTKVVGYARVSTETQAEAGVSLESQIAKLNAYAVAMDLEIVEVVVDSGVSAKTMNRPGLARIVAMLDAGDVDGVLVTKLDRLTRSVRDLGELVDRYFAERAKTPRVLLSVGDSIDTRSAAGRLVLNVLASVAQWEREATAERTRDALATKKSKGERTGSCPYGRTVAADGRTLVADEAEQAVLSEVRVLRAAGLTVKAIVGVLAAKGIVSTRTGKALGNSVVGRMIGVSA